MEIFWPLQKEQKLTSKPFVRWQWDEVECQCRERRVSLVSITECEGESSFTTSNFCYFPKSHSRLLHTTPCLQRLWMMTHSCRRWRTPSCGIKCRATAECNRDRFKRSSSSRGWATLTKFSSSFCLIASVYEPSSLVCNSVNRSLSWN